MKRGEDRKFRKDKGKARHRSTSVLRSEKVRALRASIQMMEQTERENIFSKNER